jgi:hypothetical protein
MNQRRDSAAPMLIDPEEDHQANAVLRSCCRALARLAVFQQAQHIIGRNALVAADAMDGLFCAEPGGDMAGKNNRTEKCK